MRNILPKIAVFSAVCLATWLVTSSLIARPQERPPVTSKPLAKAKLSQSRTVGLPKDDPVRRIPITTAGFIGGGRRATTAKSQSGTVEGFASMQLDSHQITIADGVATVKAHVSMIDKRQGQLYVWRLRVVAPDGSPLAGMVYDQQMFTVGVEGRKGVDFSDTVPVPEGSRRVELVLYEKSPNEDLSFLDDRDASRAHQVIRAVKLLTK